MKPLQVCLSVTVVLAMLLSSGKADDKEAGKKQAVRAVVVAAGDGDSKVIRIEGASLEEVHRILAEKLKDLPADVRKQVEAGLKKATIQPNRSGEPRVIVKRTESEKSSHDKTESPKARVEARVIRLGTDGKAHRVEVGPPKIQVRVRKKNGTAEEATKHIEIELELDGDNPKIERRIRLGIVGDESTDRELDGDKKIERRIIIRKAGDEKAHDEHTHKHSDHDGEKQLERRIMIDGTDLAKIREALAKHAHTDFTKQGHPRLIILKRDGKTAVIELMEGLPQRAEGDHAAIKKKLQSLAVEVQKKAAAARKQAAAKVAEAAKAQAATRTKLEKEIRPRLSIARAKTDAAKAASAPVRSLRRVEDSSSVDKRLDKIEGELKVIRKLLEELRKRD